jgi:hypothetical protein
MEGREEYEEEGGTAFSRSGVSPALGKCTACIKVYLPEEFALQVEMEATRAGGSASEIGRDLFFKWVTGMSYAKHVANLREAALSGKGLEKAHFDRLRVVGEVKA